MKSLDGVQDMKRLIREVPSTHCPSAPRLLLLMVTSDPQVRLMKGLKHSNLVRLRNLLRPSEDASFDSLYAQLSAHALGCTANDLGMRALQFCDS